MESFRRTKPDGYDRSTLKRHSFGRRFGVAEARLAALTPGGVQESQEIYPLCDTDGNAKIRDALTDVKVLRQANGTGRDMTDA